MWISEFVVFNGEKQWQKKWIFLGNKKLDLEVGIHKNSEIVEVKLKNIIKNLKCEKNIFRM